MRNRSTGIILSYINTALNMLTGLFLSAYLLRMLGNAEYGIYKTIAAFATCLVLFEFGTGTVMTRNLSICRAKKCSYEEIERNISTIWVITNVLAVGIMLVAIVFYFSLGYLYANTFTLEEIVYGKKIFVFTAVYTLLSFYCQTLNGIVLAYEYYSYSSLVSILRISIRTILLIGLIANFKHAIVISIVDMSLSLLILIVTYVFCKKTCHITISLRHFDKTVFRESLPLSMAIFLQTVVNQANNNVDSFLIGIKLNPESVALYSIGIYIYSVFSSLTTIPISMYAPQIIKDVGRGMKKKELTNSLIQPCRLIVLIGGLVLFGFITVGKQFIEIVYGPSYVSAWIVALLIMIPMYINMANGVLVNVLDAMNKRMFRSTVLIVTTIANIVLTVLWLDKWGMIGAAAATAVCTFIGQDIIMNIYYFKELKIPVMYLFKETFRGILLFQITGMISGLLISHFIKNPYISLLISGIVFILFFMGLFWKYGANETEKIMIKKLFKERGRANG